MVLQWSVFQYSVKFPSFSIRDADDSEMEEGVGCWSVKGHRKSQGCVFFIQIGAVWLWRNNPGSYSQTGGYKSPSFTYIYHKAKELDTFSIRETSPGVNLTSISTQSIFVFDTWSSVSERCELWVIYLFPWLVELGWRRSPPNTVSETDRQSKVLKRRNGVSVGIWWRCSGCRRDEEGVWCPDQWVSGRTEAEEWIQRWTEIYLYCCITLWCYCGVGKALVLKWALKSETRWTARSGFSGRERLKWKFLHMRPSRLQRWGSWGMPLWETARVFNTEFYTYLTPSPQIRITWLWKIYFCFCSLSKRGVASVCQFQ